MKQGQGHDDTSSLNKTEVFRAGSREKEDPESRKEEEDYSLLSKEVEMRLQRQIEGMDQDRKVYQAATVKLVRYLHLHLHLYLHLHLHCISLHTVSVSHTPN